MAMQKLRLVGCDRYNLKGELYERGKVYMVGEAKATIMLRKEDEFGRLYFAPYVAEGKSKNQRIAEAAAAAAAKAAAEAIQEEVIVDRTGEEPIDPDAVVEADPDAAVEVDMDDADLDDLDDANPEEVNVDRDDGTAVEV